MTEDIKVIKSPLAYEQDFVTIQERMMINITLPNGMIITDPEQFQDNDYYIKDYNTEFMEQ